MESLKGRAAALKHEIDEAAARAKLSDLEQAHSELLEQVSSPDFWQTNPDAQQIAQQEGSLARKVQPWRNLVEAAAELVELIELGDQSMLADLQKQVDNIEQMFDSIKQDLKFTGPYDDHDVILNIYAGAGGTDAQDWAQMLERMYYDGLKNGE